MGDPKYPRRAWRKPKRPLNYDLKMDELKTLGTFGLRTKRELWKAHTELSRVRHQARSLLALRAEDRSKKEPILMRSLARIGLVSPDATLDDVLNLKVSDLLARRFQTIVTKKFEFKTPYQARQAVVHGHMMIGERRINIPSYVVTVEEEGSIRFAAESKIPERLEKRRQDDRGSDNEEDDHEAAGSDAAEGAEVKQQDVQNEQQQQAQNDGDTGSEQGAKDDAVQNAETAPAAENAPAGSSSQ